MATIKKFDYLDNTAMIKHMRDTIKNHKDFLMTDDNPVAKSSFFYVRMKPCVISGNARYGVVATKKTFKLATERNRAKRLLRDWLRFNEDYMLPDMDYVVIARHAILLATRDDGRCAMARALKNLNKNQKSNDVE